MRIREAGLGWVKRLLALFTVLSRERDQQLPEEAKNCFLRGCWKSKIRILGQLGRCILLKGSTESGERRQEQGLRSV